MRPASEIIAEKFPGATSELKGKIEKLFEIIRRYDSAVVAFSGGVDSTLLGWAAGAALDGKALLVTAVSPTYPAFELDEAKEIAAILKLPYEIITTHEFENPTFTENPPDRCYYCKFELFDQILKLARARGYATAFEGGNLDDLGDVRPGRRALEELKVNSPLCMASLTKAEIRTLSEKLGLPTATKPSYACLASRFPYGEHIDHEKLSRVEKAETELRKMGFTQFRVRSHGNLARIELMPQDMDKGWQQRATIARLCTESGFIFSCIDLKGYRTGAMNEALV